MDSIFKRRMKENHKWFLYMSLIYGGIFVFCMYRNLSGITFPIVMKSVGDHISDSYCSNTRIFHIILKENRYYSAERYNTLFYRDYSAGNIHSTDG